MAPKWIWSPPDPLTDEYLQTRIDRRPISARRRRRLLLAIEQVKNDFPGATCVAILPDSGERYLDTSYSDSRVKEHFGEVADLWERSLEAQPCVTTASSF